MPEELQPGLYELPVTRALERALAALPADLVRTGALEESDGDLVLTRHLASRLLAALRAGEDVNQKLALVNALDALLGDEADPVTARLLLAILRASEGPAQPREPTRPTVPLALGALLVNGRDQPRIGTEVAREVESADAVDLLCAFVKWSGIRVILPQIEAFCAGGRPLRIITTTYIGATERRALDHLCALGAQVKVSYESRSTRLHAKAWLFHRASGFSSAYVGSSNLSRAALLDGLEWNVRVAQAEQPYLLETVRATFEEYWSDPSFETYDPARDAERFDQAVAAEMAGAGSLPIDIAVLDVQPWPFQREMLDRLEAERTLHQRWRNLVVAATGTGKTVIAALDYKRLRDAGIVDRLLFVAHREEILAQSMRTFRHVLRSGSFGEDLVAGRKPAQWRHVFASIQSLAKADLTAVAPDHFDMVVVDEFHHAMAPTYERLLEHVRPRVLLGLTATPERMDQRDVTEWFGGRIAVELRLWEALERELLCPFQYFGVHDNSDLSRVQWRRGRGYDTEALTNLYTGDDMRARLIFQGLLDKVGDPRAIRALGFCVSIAHAEFMAQRFRDFGLPSVAISSRSTSADRAASMEALRDRTVNVLFAVDLFNEGLDIPEIDTVLFLRPTESATVFLQQLGRGLRRTDGKSCLTVLDFIGNQHASFRFDLRYRALTGATRRELEHHVRTGFPFLPAGCHMELDSVSTQIVLANIRASLNLPWKDLVAELRRLGDVRLAEFLSDLEWEPEDLYRRRKGGWSALRREAGVSPNLPGPHDAALSRAFSRVLHLDDLERLEFWRAALTRARGDPSGREGRLLAMMHFSLWGSNVPLDAAPARLTDLVNDPDRRAELLELLAVLADRTARVTRPIDDAGMVPLHIHARYSRDEALAAFGHDKPSSMRQGPIYFRTTGDDVFFITLNKTERHYSPTTRYNDYAISSNLFHWESQSLTTVGSPTGQRYINHRAMGSRVHLFIRHNKVEDPALGAPPYLYAGTADYVSHESERPMKIVWKLDHDLPPELFLAAKFVAG